MIHEAAIGKIAGEQLIKLMTLGLTEQEAANVAETVGLGALKYFLLKVDPRKNITFNLAGFSYTVDGTLVGSAGTERCGFQLLKGSDVTFKNGSLIASTAARKPGDDSKGIAMFIQNYSDLTLENVTVDANGKIVFIGIQ